MFQWQLLDSFVYSRYIHMHGWAGNMAIQKYYFFDD